MKDNFNKESESCSNLLNKETQKNVNTFPTTDVLDDKFC